MSKASKFLEDLKIFEPKIESERGTYTAKYTVEVDLSGSLSATNDLEELISEYEDLTSERKWERVLDSPVWDAIRHYQCVDGVLIDVSVDAPHPYDFTDPEQFRQGLTKVRFEFTFNISTDLPVETRVEIDNRIRKAIEGQMK